MRCMRLAGKHPGMPSIHFGGSPLKMLGFVIPVSLQCSLKFVSLITPCRYVKFSWYSIEDTHGIF